MSDCMEMPKPLQEHAFLQNLVGRWVMTGQEGQGPGDGEGAETGSSWTEEFRSLGGLWVVGDGRGRLGPHGPEAETVLTIGYDPDEKAYVGTWLGTMMPKLWVYKGWLEPDGKTLVLECEGPDFTDPSKTIRMRDTTVLHDDGTRSFIGSAEQPDGTFKVFMSSHFRREG